MRSAGPDRLELVEPRTAPTSPARARASAREREPVLFWAERDPGLAMGGWAVVTALFLPLGFFFPEGVLGGAALTALWTWLNLKAFRLELTPWSLRYRPGLLARTMVWPLEAVARVEVRDPAMQPVRWGREPPRVGHLLIELPEGLLAISGIKDPQEFADAVGTIRAGGTGPVRG
ncbi:MAG: hypothetical protein NZ555_13355 [Geminicoccaceae bacterium]|nr:hypothetical protein [Geminicoccaceae bacterium]MCX8101664.1 hypothetical protein [Geminicoccaceae bacterium]MDW8371678.1 hypothetical protein [Geminicoccaceae bacterium]